jgi:hypothetical protein
VAAFCVCCGAKITLKAEACPVCGNPRHGMLQPDPLLTLDIGVDVSQQDEKSIGSCVSRHPIGGRKSTAKSVQRS